MAKINFYLKGVLSKEKLLTLKHTSQIVYEKELLKMRPIICSISIAGDRLILFTAKSIPLKYWDPNKQNVKYTLAGANLSYRELYQWVNDKKSQIEMHIGDQQLNDHYVDEKSLRQFFHSDFPVKNKTSLQDLLDQFIEEHRTQSGYKLKCQMIKKYRVLGNHILKFEGNHGLVPNKLTTNWLNNFKDFLNETLNLNDNSVSKYIRAIKTFIKYLRKQGNHIPAVLEDIKAPEKAQIVNILEQNELDYLRNFEFIDPFLAQIRDVFVFQCYTGQRFSDIQHLSRADISTSNGTSIWLLSTQKTDDFIQVPLANTALAILKKYEHLPFPLPRFSNQYFNRMLKEVGRTAGLNRPVKKIAFRKNIKKGVTMPLYAIMSSHIARKTFISLSLKKKMPERHIRIISGHKGEKSFRAYVNIGNSHIDSFLESWN